MKKLLVGLAVVVLVLFGGLQIAQKMVMGGESYYVQITTNGEKSTSQDSNGNVSNEYDYDLTGYNENGESKELSFTAFKDRPLRKEAYLKITWNEKRGVTSYEEVQASDIPTKALNQLKGA
ncbi:hypothetical protein A5886_001042 [Enterococcus sp. 8G7_MSG3316]|uniref:YxeA family protein n=1 Tax=Candidatus Enterococcus testudinis TaxID=1834191 RepID=A0A242A4K4_9ENTE|nr:YxeA family protein [Enterococcus sp. 8G7_MSG3316]OTN75966.1 hypothetical protein A5886_001042 [Enterococcus sp. 8G7_MSG3316]